MIRRYYIALAVVALVVTLSSVAAALAQVPQLPHVFYGDLTVASNPAPAGAIIVATVDGGGGTLTTTVLGKYGGPGAFDPKLLVQGSINPGSEIQFFVNGAAADQTLAYESGAITELNLTAPEPEPTPTPVPPTPTPTPPPPGPGPGPTGGGGGGGGGFSLTVAKAGTGRGTVTDAPRRIDCGGDCSEVYALGSTVTLTATADPGSTFTSWSGDGTGAAPGPRTVGINTGEIVRPLSVTATFTLQPPAPPAPPAPLLLTNEQGVLQAPGVLTSSDGLLVLNIPAGTTVLTVGGTPVTDLTVQCTAELPPAPPEQIVIGLVCDLQPNGATFDPQVRLTFEYDPALLPPGVDEEAIVIALYNSDTAQWEALEDITVDTANNTISGSVSHLTLFGVVAKQPPPATATPTPTATPPPTPTATTPPPTTPPPTPTATTPPPTPTATTPPPTPTATPVPTPTATPVPPPTATPVPPPTPVVELPPPGDGVLPGPDIIWIVLGVIAVIAAGGFLYLWRSRRIFQT